MLGNLLLRTHWTCARHHLITKIAGCALTCDRIWLQDTISDRVNAWQHTHCTCARQHLFTKTVGCALTCDLVWLQETMSDRVKAWQHGLVSDGELEWEKRCLQLAQHAQQHGDAHIGYRDGEDSDLARWARKQRHAHRCNTLTSQRYLQNMYSTALCDAFIGTRGGKREAGSECGVCIHV